MAQSTTNSVCNYVKPVENLNMSGNLSENWKRFKLNFDIFSVAAGVDKLSEAVKIATFLNAVGTEALEVYQTFDLDADSKTKYSKVIKSFEDFCSPKKNQVFERFTFYNRNQGEREPFENFLTDLKKLARSCEFGEQEEAMIRDRIVLGINDKLLQERLLQMEDLDMKTAINKARLWEITQDQARKIHETPTASTSVNPVHFLDKKDKYYPKKYVKKETIESKKPNQANNDYNKFRKCYRCLTHHRPKACPAFNKICTNCNKLNHFSIACHLKNVRHLNLQETPIDAPDCHDTDNNLYIHSLNEDITCKNSIYRKEWMEKIKVGDVDVEFKLDSGADCNILPMNILETIADKKQIKPTSSVLEAYGGQKIKPLGSINLLCQNRKGERGVFPFIILPENYIPILGKYTCTELNLIERINNVKTFHDNDIDKRNFISDNIECFTGIGKFPKPYHISVKDNCIPVVCPPHRVPIKIRDKLQNHIQHLVKLGILERADEPAEWLNNLVIVEKKTGDLRICLSPLELNKYLIREPFLMPTLEEMSHSLSGMKYFSVLDFNCGFWNIELDKESRALTTFATPFGYNYRFCRLPFGLSISSEIFMKYVKDNFGDINGVIAYVDDLLVMGRTLEEHDKNLKKVIDRAREINIKFNPDKFQFRVNEVNYLGHIFSQNGIQIDKSKIEAIEKLDTPNNKKELMKLLGILNFLRSYVRNMSEITHPLRILLKKDSLFHWTSIHTKALENIKQSIREAPILESFDPLKDITLECDSSMNGIGCCLIQNNRPVAFASRSLSETERNYSMIEKEFMGIIFACQKFHNFIYGKPIKVKTDHKPLLSIMKKDIRKIPSPKLQRMRLKLLNYDIQLEYVPGRYMHISDYLSRHFIQQDSETEDDFLKGLVHTISMSDEKIRVFQQETNNDSVLKHVITQCRNGWPNSKTKVPNEIKFYYKYRNDIFLEDGILFLNDRVMVPLNLRQEMLEQLHQSHFGISKTKSRAHELLYWPNMNEQIENIISKCHICQVNQSQNIKEPMVQSKLPNLPFTKVTCDILEYSQKYYLVLIDYYSKWIELINLKNKNSTSIIDAWLEIFSRFGFPKTLLADNNPFDSYECKNFARENNFQIITSSPNYPKGHSLAEKAVHICKNILKKCDTSKKIYNSLLEYRNTKTKDLQYSPSQLLQNRRCRTSLPIKETLLKPAINRGVRKQLENKVNNYRAYYDYDSRKRNDFKINQRILFLLNGKWLRGRIINFASTPRSYIIKSDFNRVYRRNSTHMKIYREPFEFDSTPQIINDNTCENKRHSFQYKHVLRSGTQY